jgi:hypothetical protein
MNVKENRKLKEDRKVYGNWEVLHPDGELMFRCNDKKANWYLKRNLAQLLGENKIQLMFIPQGKGHINEPFYLTVKQNICVVCATTKFLTKHHTVPHCFRKFFPEQLKSKNSHDIVLLCRECHNTYETEAWELKVEIAKKYGIDFQPKVEISEEDKNKKKAINFAYSLIEHGDKIPEIRKQELIKFLVPYVSDPYNNNDIQNFIDRNHLKDKGWHSTNLGEIVMSKVEDMDSFNKMWREHFVAIMKPKHLPELWSVDHKRAINDTI